MKEYRRSSLEDLDDAPGFEVYYAKPSEPVRIAETRSISFRATVTLFGMATSFEPSSDEAAVMI